MTQPPSTADYRKYPKGPNFKLIVILSSVFLVLGLLAAYLLLSDEGRKLLPLKHTQNVVATSSVCV